MKPWNPYAMTFHGQPITGQTPPKLVVHGPPLTAQQGAMLQTAYNAFVGAARVSIVPNPTRQGRLLDGSPYTIECVQGSCTCNVWTVAGGSAADFTRGIAFFADTTWAVIYYVGGVWRYRLEKTVYGGEGTWAASNSRLYLTDHSIPRHDRSWDCWKKYYVGGMVSFYGDRGDTCNIGGLAYRHGNIHASGHSFSVINPAGLVVNMYLGSSAISVSATESVATKDIAKTPDEYAATPEVVATVPVPALPGKTFRTDPLDPGLVGRLRTGAAFLFSLGEVNKKLGAMPRFPRSFSAGPKFISVLPTTHDLRVSASPPYEASIEPVASIGKLEVLPDKEPTPDGLPYYTVTVSQTGALLGYDIIEKPVTFLSTTFVTPVAAVNVVTNLDRSTNIKRKVDTKYPCAVYHGWDDSRIVLDISASCEFDMDMTQDLTYMSSRSFNQNIGGSWWEITPDNGNALVPPGGSIISTLGGMAPEHQAELTAAINASSLGNKFLCEAVIHEKTKYTLHAPEDEIVLTDIDVTVTATKEYLYGYYHPTGGWSYKYKFTNATGSVMRRDLVQVVPDLGLLVFVETNISGFSVSAEGDISASGASAKLVARVRGETIYESSIPCNAGHIGHTEASQWFTWWFTGVPPGVTETVNPSNAISITGYLIIKPPETTELEVVTGPKTVYPGWSGNAIAEQSIDMATSMLSASIPEAAGELPPFSVRFSIDPNSGAGMLLIGTSSDRTPITITREGVVGDARDFVRVDGAPPADCGVRVISV